MRFGASAVLVESTIADCQTRDSRGGGAYVDQANLTLQGGSRVERCLADWGGGLAAFEAEIALLEGSVLSECHAISYAGGLHARLSRGRMMQSAIVNCTASRMMAALATIGGSFLAIDSVRALRLERGPRAPYCPKERSHATLAGLRRL